MALLGGVALLAVLAGACGGNDRRIQGLQRTDPLVVSDVSLPRVNADGTSSAFPLRASAGKLLVMYFGYTSCPDVCPTTLTYLAKALDELGGKASQVEVAMATVDPQVDTPAVLTNYLAHFVAGASALRTEDPAQLAQVEEAFLASSTLTPRPDGGHDVSHTGTTYLVDEQGRVIDEWPFGTSAATMANDLSILVDRLD